MLQLLQNFSIAQIIIFIVMLAIAFKGVISFWDWVVAWLRKKFNKESEEEIKFKEIEEKIGRDEQKITDLRENQKQIQESMETLMDKIDVLVESDKDDIKSFIVKEHHFFCYQKGWIDDYSMDSIEKRFKHYQDEGGNSYIEELMKDLRSLEHRPPKE